MRALILMLLMTLPGCASLPFGQSAPEQVKAMTQDASAWCGTIVAAGMTAKITSVNVDKGVVRPTQGSTAKINGSNCDAEITISPPPPPVAKP